MESQVSNKSTWAGTLALVALIFSALLSATYFLNPVWEHSDAVQAFFGGSGDGSALFLLYFLCLAALILDLVAIAVTFIFVPKKRWTPNLIVGVIAVLAAAAPLALGAV